MPEPEGDKEILGATIVAFSDKSAAAPDRLFLDANAVIDLLSHETAMLVPRPGQPRRGQKHPDLVGCLSRLRAAKTALIVTPAVLEEVFHVLSTPLVARLEERLACSQCAGAREKALRKHHPKEFGDMRKECVRLFRNAVTAAKKHGVRVWVADGSHLPDEIGEKILTAFVSLIDGCMHIGGKDALHIVTAALIECTSFVTRDDGFRHVPKITVYSQHA